MKNLIYLLRIAGSIIKLFIVGVVWKTFADINGREKNERELRRVL